MSGAPTPSWAPGGWIPAFNFSDETTQALVAFAKKHEIEDTALFIKKVQTICRAYLGFRGSEVARISEGEVNAMLRNLVKHAEAIGELLKQREVSHKLSNLAMVTSKFWFLRGGRDFLRELPKNLKTLVEIGNTLPPKGAGRPKGGGKNNSGHHLAVRLCYCLTGHGIRVRNTVSEGRQVGLAHQLLDIVRAPLGLGAGELDGILNNVINDMKKDNILN